MNIEQKVKDFLGEFFDVTQISNEDNIFEMGLVNSLFAMQLVNFIEQEFDVTVDNDDLDIENFKNINAISALVKFKVESQEDV